MIQLVDPAGVQSLVTISEFREQVIPGQLQFTWENPDALYGVIMWAINEDCPECVVDAADHLHDIDPNAERSCTARVAVLIECGRLEEARALIESYVRASSGTPWILTLLSRTFQAMNLSAKAQAAAWQALEIDPNDMSALLWWMELLSPDRNPQTMRAALQRVASIPGTWHARVLLGRLDVEAGDLRSGLAMIRDALQCGGQSEPVAFGLISAGLGQSGHPREALSLLLAPYDPTIHGIDAGMNLIGCALDARDTEAASSLLDRLRALNVEELRGPLDEYARELREIRGHAGPSVLQGSSEAPAETPDPYEVHQPDVPMELAIHAIENPVWFDALRWPAWMMADRSSEAPSVRIALLPLACPRDDDEVPAEGIRERETEAGQVSRGLLLYLHEWIELCTDADPVCLVPLVVGAGPVLSGTKPDPADIQSFLAQAGGAATHALTGTVRASSTLDVELEVIRVEDGEILFTIEECASGPADLGRFLDEVVNRLQFGMITFAHVSEAPRPSWYARPADEYAYPYLMGQAQLLALSIVAAGFGDREDLWGERNILQWQTRLAAELAGSGTEVGAIMMLAGLAANREYGSQLYREFMDHALAMDRAYQGTPTSMYHRLTPLLYSIFEMGDELRASLESIRASSPDLDYRYDDWLTRI